MADSGSFLPRSPKNRSSLELPGRWQNPVLLILRVPGSPWRNSGEGCRFQSCPCKTGQSGLGVSRLTLSWSVNMPHHRGSVPVQSFPFQFQSRQRTNRWSPAFERPISPTSPLPSSLRPSPFPQTCEKWQGFLGSVVTGQSLRLDGGQTFLENGVFAFRDLHLQND